MSRPPDCSQNLSLKLSEVLCDIGVNESMVKKRRKMVMLEESVLNSTGRLLGMNVSCFNYGSQSESATTIGLNSDSDTLFCDNKYNVIQDWSEWQFGMENFLMIQDETTSPGYCLLQKLRDDEPLPLPTALLEHLPDRRFTVRGDKVLLKNTAFNDIGLPGQVLNGPAHSSQGVPGFSDEDHVVAYRCKSWPVEARPWLERQGIGRWPTENMKRYCETTGCFVVPVASKSGLNEELEWRVSTSQAERCLMFSLNITQLRCYILMKMILKTFINPQCGSVISSFMCKTVLFHCIQIYSNNWRKPNLLANLIHCLKVLQTFISNENCPHFIIPENNLMAGRISPRHKLKILEILQNIVQSDGRALLEITIDNLGMRLQMKINMVETYLFYESPADIFAVYSARLLNSITNEIGVCHNALLNEVMHDGNEMARERLVHFLVTLVRTQREMSSSSLDKSACKLLTPLICSSLASVIASHDISTTHSLSPHALVLFSAGLSSDVSSGRLKLASALYCAGDMERAELVLKNTEEKYDLNTVEPECGCTDFARKNQRQGFLNKCNTGNEELIKHIKGLCIKFLRCEINCVPKELQYEMFRSTHEDMLERHKHLDRWMDLAVVDSLPYLYFMQYKIYSALQRAPEKQRALENLISVIDTELNLPHRETALNLLGQCFEHENRHNDALRCYMMSLEIRRRNNAANIHIQRLSGVVNM